MKNRLFFFISAFLIYNAILCQISPGKLTDVHSHLEGISNCTKCHDLGKKVTNEKCLDCHIELKVRIEQRKGYHVSKEVKSVSCISCHSDHHGLKFEIVRFDTKKFEHRLTGYELSGKHSETECVKCHTKSNIYDVKLKAKEFTYLGLTDQCKSCHADVHKGTLSSNCATCHTTSSFKPASNFDHDKTKYPLLGMHKKVDCVECHKIENIGDKSFQYFADTKFDQCSSCHDVPHDKKFGINCSACHNYESFEQINTKINFNHNVTGYILKGKHKVIDCKTCHVDSWTDTNNAFKDYKERKIESCVGCHKDIHENRLGQNCILCHTEQTFKLEKTSSAFNHDMTSYPLEGVHLLVDCNKCHKSKLTDDLPHTNCNDCHADFHKNNLRKNDQALQDCSLCHTVNSFNETTFGIDRHANTKFPLLGAHQAIACFECHKENGAWNFANKGSACIDCHEDIHAEHLSDTYYPAKSCIVCHNENSWKELKFNHDITSFALRGKHANTSCVDCHKSNPKKEGQIIQFKLQSIDCHSCHADIHLNQFSINGKIDCSKCHGFDRWKIDYFDHSKTNFNLEGAHEKVTCDRCHKLIQIKEVNCIQYKLPSYKCLDCHL